MNFDPGACGGTVRRDAANLLADNLKLPPEIAAATDGVAAAPADGMARDAKFAR